MVKKRQGKVECGDEVDHLLLDLALAKFGRTEDTITDHRDIVFVWISVFFSFFFSIAPLLFSNSELAAADTRFPQKPPVKPFKCEVV